VYIPQWFSKRYNFYTENKSFEELSKPEMACDISVYDNMDITEILKDLVATAAPATFLVMKKVM